MTASQEQIIKLRSLGETCFRAGDYVNARKNLETAVALGCNESAVVSSLGYTCYLVGDYKAALKHCELAKEINPLFIDNYTNLALSLYGLKRYHQALIVIDEGLEIDPKAADLWVNRGLTYMALNRPIDAQYAYRSALSIAPENLSALTNFAMALQDTGLAERASEYYRRALRIDPSFRHALSNSLMCAQYNPELASAEILALTTNVAGQYAAKVQSYSDAKKQVKRDGDKYTLGLYSPDLRAHPVGWFVRDVLKVLAERFNIVVYSFSVTQDGVTEELKLSTAQWHTCVGWSPLQIVEQSARDGIDLAIDLAGHTAGGAMSAFAHRVAPKQVSWLGFPASTGLANSDGTLLSDDLCTEATLSFFAEPVLAYGGPQFVYTPPHYIPDVAQAPHLKNGFITFGCFNNLAKLNDNVVATWATIMQRMPESRLLLKWKSLADPQVKDAVLKRFFACGVAQQRIELRGASEHTQMFREYGDIDIALDPFPFSGALTSFEAVWMGVPAVTLAGFRPMSRQTMSINKALGLEQLTADTPLEYANAAVSLAQNSGRLSELRSSMRDRLISSPLSDARAMADAIGEQFELVLIKGVKAL